MITIYKITNRLNRKIYVGQTKQSIEKRFLQHSKTNSPLGNAMRSCGLENFTIEVIEECETQDQANRQERFWINALNCKMPNGYNRSNGGEGGIHKPRTSPVNTMKLGEYLAMYRARNKLTMQNMADACGFSKAYISMLEKGINPTTGKPVSPTMQAFEKIAKATGQDLDSLLKILDGDQPITISATNSLNSEEMKLVDEFRSLDNDGRKDFWSYLKFLQFKYAAPHVAAV